MSVNGQEIRLQPRQDSPASQALVQYLDTSDPEIKLQVMAFQGYISNASEKKSPEWGTGITVKVGLTTPHGGWISWDDLKWNVKSAKNVGGTFDVGGELSPGDNEELEFVVDGLKRRTNPAEPLVLIKDLKVRCQLNK